MAKRITMETVSDAETATVVFVARALWYTANYGNRAEVRRCLRGIGLGDYVDGERDRFTVNLATFKELLGDTLEIAVERGYNYTPANSSYVVDKLVRIAEGWRDNLHESQWSKIEEPSKHVDADAIVARFGSRGDLPPVEGDEPRATWAELVAKVLAWADDRGLCGDVESALRTIGFGEFLPPATMKVAVTWRGVTIEDVEVGVNRKGEPRLDDACYHIQMLVRQETLQIETAPAASVPVAV